MSFDELVSSVELNKKYLYRNRFGRPTAGSFEVIEKNSSCIEFLTKSGGSHKLKPEDWEEVVTNLRSLRSGTMQRKMLRSWRPSYAYAFIGYLEEKGIEFGV